MRVVCTALCVLGSAVRKCVRMCASWGKSWDKLELLRTITLDKLEQMASAASRQRLRGDEFGAVGVRCVSRPGRAVRLPSPAVTGELYENVSCSRIFFK